MEVPQNWGYSRFPGISSDWLDPKFRVVLCSIHGMVELVDNPAKGHWYAIRRGKARETDSSECTVDKLISLVDLEVWHFFYFFCFTFAPVIENENSRFSRSLLSPGSNMQHMYTADGVRECGTTGFPPKMGPQQFSI